MDSSKIYVIIPAYNPGKMIENVVNKSLKYCKNILIVDDGCDELNKSILQKLNQLTGIKLLVHAENKGKGFAIKTGLKYALENQAETIIMLDSDGQHKPEELADFINFSENNSFDLVMGVRTDIEKMPLKSKIGNLSIAFGFNLFYGQKLNDTQSGYRMLSSKFANLFLENIEAGRYETEMKMLILAAKNKITIHQIPIETQYFDGNANSKFRPVIDSIRVLGSFVKYTSVGFTSFLIDYALFLMLTYFFGIYFLTAHIISRICSGTFNFIANKNFVFRHKQSVFISFIKYLVAVFISLSLSSALLYLLVDVFLIESAAAKLVAEASTFLLNYYVLKHFVFKK